MAIETVSEPAVSGEVVGEGQRRELHTLKHLLGDVGCLLEAIEQIAGGKNSCEGRLAGMALLKLVDAESNVAALGLGAQ